MRTTVTLVAALMLMGCGNAPETTTTEPVVEVTQAKTVTVTSKSPEAIAAFEQGRALLESFRDDEAIGKLDEALALDPEFALANAYRGMQREGNDGLEQLRKAKALAAAIPEAERLQIEAMLAQREGDSAHARELWGKVAALAPDDVRVQNMLGTLAFGESDWKGAADALTRATEIDGSSGIAWNMLGYARAMTGDYDGAIAALTKYAELAPTEPNPQDSLGEVLMMAGRFEEAEKAFTRATEISPAFELGFQGIAQTRFLRGDWEGGRTALGQAIAAASRPEERFGLRADLAWSWLAAGDPAQAATVLAEAETEAQGANLLVSHAQVAGIRAAFAAFSENWTEMETQAQEMITRAEAAKLEGAALAWIRLGSDLDKVMALSMQGKGAEAEALIASIEANAAKLTPDDSMVHLAKGTVALGKGDTAAAVASLSQCDARDTLGLWMLVQAHQRAGDPTAAEATREKVLALNHRGGEYLAFWAKAGGPAALAATTTAE